MVTFLKIVGDTAFLRVIATKQSKMIAAIHGQDVCGMDGVMNTINNDDKVEHVALSLTYYEDQNEEDISNYLKLNNTVTKRLNSSNSEESNSDNEESEEETEETSEETSETEEVDEDYYKCPKCGNYEALVDRNGNKYPCYACMQIDIGRRIINDYGKNIKKSLNELNQNNKDISEELKKLNQKEEGK